MRLIKKILRRKPVNDEEWLKQKSIFCNIDVDKYYNEWRESRLDGRSPISEGIPWIAFEARDYLARFLTKDMCVFEYGSGGSSLYLSQRVKEVVSVEHDAAWFESVQTAMSQRGIKNWRGRCVPPQVGSIGHGRPEAPEDYTSADLPGSNFKDYVCTLDEYEDERFDVILVDGRARPSCLVHSLPKVRLGGLLMLDNADRSYYTALTAALIGERYSLVLDRYGPFPFVPGFLKTTIWTRSK